MDDNTLLVVGLGEALFDCLPDGKKLGGAPANFAYHAGQFGLPALAISAIGNDALGRELQQELDSHRLNALLPVVPYETGTVQVTLNGAGIPQYEIKEGVAWDNIPYTEEMRQVARRTQAVCFGSLAQRSETSRNTIRAFLNDMPQGDNILKVFDINLRQNFYGKSLVEESLQACNVLKINDEELITLSKMFGWEETDPEAQCRKLADSYGLRLLILTCGTDGSYVFTPDGSHFEPTPRVEVADTVGAGDSFTGSFVASILKRKTPAEAHKTAVKVSAFVCTQPGAMPQVPEELKA